MPIGIFSGGEDGGVTINPSPPPPPPPSGAVAVFSSDESMVTINWKGGTWTFPRPVISPWNYTTTGTTYWVATNGNDSNNGLYQTPGTPPNGPFASISKGAAAAVAGDIVYVQAGTYFDNVSYIFKSGVAGKPIILSCAPGALGKVTIKPTDNFLNTCSVNDAIFQMLSVSYIWINGFNVEGPMGRPNTNPNPPGYPGHTESKSDSSNLDGFCGIAFSNGCKNCNVTNNVVYNCPHVGIKTWDSGETFILVQANLTFFNGFTTGDHGLYGPGNNCTFDGNISFNNNLGISLTLYSSPQNCIVTRNIFFGNSEGLQLAGSGCQVYNNTSVSHHVLEGYGMLHYATDSNNIIKNNIFAFNNNDSPVAGSGTGNVEDYNDYHQGVPSWGGANSIAVDPLFINAAAGDYRLAAGSRCINAGVFITGFSSQSPRPNMGAFGW